ncbi:hypothetical protein ON010_g16188 [Phytophthora cinnamomi]|nr:hypothetical protein ON010_g16188 [Phytophthora cinnamomi]
MFAEFKQLNDTADKVREGADAVIEVGKAPSVPSLQVDTLEDKQADLQSSWPVGETPRSCTPLRSRTFRRCDDFRTPMVLDNSFVGYAHLVDDKGRIRWMSGDTESVGRLSEGGQGAASAELPVSKIQYYDHGGGRVAGHVLHELDSMSTSGSSSSASITTSSLNCTAEERSEPHNYRRVRGGHVHFVQHDYGPPSLWHGVCDEAPGSRRRTTQLLLLRRRLRQRQHEGRDGQQSRAVRAVDPAATGLASMRPTAASRTIAAHRVLSTPVGSKAEQVERAGQPFAGGEGLQARFPNAQFASRVLLEGADPNDNSLRLA